MATASHRAHSQDRLLVANVGDAWILGLADGAGGVAGGAEAAELFIARVHQAAYQRAFDTTTPEAWSALLVQIDEEIRASPAAGETTGIAIAVRPTELVGASSGDSEAWRFAAEVRDQLTEGQARRPRLGSGRALPRGFRAASNGVLVLGSDGLFGHALHDDIARIALADPRHAATGLVEHLTSRYRRLPDDVAVIVGALG